MPAPNTPTDLIDRIRALERQVQDLAGRVNIRPALNTIVGGSVTIKDGGSLKVIDSDLNELINVGRMYPDLNGKPQMATMFRRSNGTKAFAVYTPASSGIQPVQMYDNNGSVIVADEVVSAGGGLAVPYLTFPSPKPTANTSWQSTTSTAYTELEWSKGFVHHARLRVVASGVGTGGIRVMVNGTQVIEVTGTNPEIDDYVSVPSWNYNGSPQMKTVSLQAKVTTSGTTMRAVLRSVSGVPS